ncbi:hypothetical protein BDV93DRAFT_509922 [Ceratobasidium sp. AG-I]|nr:hypothetical protein BDV93DRAFT_509922 [Ceratobasidium sp. AG-I]
MFVLQDCSICLEDFDEERSPYNISCACPNCRAPIDQSKIQRVLCSLYEPPALPTSAQSDAERSLWAEISSVIDSAEEHEQRKLLVQNYSRLAVCRAGFSVNARVALEALRLLVEVENRNHASEANTRNQVLLEARQGGIRANSMYQFVEKLRFLALDVLRKASPTESYPMRIWLLLASLPMIFIAAILVGLAPSSSPTTQVMLNTPLAPDIPVQYDSYFVKLF